jgi:hypothetical protein
VFGGVSHPVIKIQELPGHTVGAKSIFSRRRKVSNFNQQYLGLWMRKERRRFRHFSQQGQGFFEVKNQLFSTFGFSAAGPQIRNIFSVHFFGEKILPSGKYYT